MYENLRNFINKAKERRFNDALINVVIVEIQIKSREINEEMILPRYYDIGCFYENKYYAFAGKIKEVLPKKCFLK